MVTTVNVTRRTDVQGFDFQLVHTADTDETKLSCLVLSVSTV